MPTPKTHYRGALGEHNDQHSWIIHSAKGIKWHNIPNELVTLLQKLSVNELLDFALGSGGRWYVRYRQKGPERQALSPNLWVELGQGSNVKLDRLTLGPDADHWGVQRAAGGSFQRFSSVGNRDRFTRLLDSKTENIKSNNQIGFVSLGHSGDWAFRVNGHVEHRCSKPFHNELTGGWKARKRVSTVILSPMARVWIILWEDGTHSHNLPSNISTEVEDFCQLQYSLIANLNQQNSGRPTPQQARHGRNNNQPETSSSAQRQPSTTNPTQAVNPRVTHNRASNATQSSSTRQIINNPPKVPSIPGASLPAPPPVPPAATAPTVSQPSIPGASTSTHQPTTKLVPTQLPASSIQVPKAPSIVKPGPAQNNVKAWNTTQPPSTQQTIKNRLNVVPVPATTLPAPPPISLTVSATPVPKDPITTKSALIQQPATKPALTRLSTPIRVPKALSTVKPVEATLFTTEPTSQIPLTRVKAVSTKPKVYVRPKQQSTTLRLLDASAWPDSAEYEKVARHFENGWKHEHKKVPNIKRIFAVCLPDHLNETYEEYNDRLERQNGWRGANEQLVFHGTERICSLGEKDEHVTLCQRTTCRLCCILQTSFLVSKAGSAGRSFKRFGPGIYTSSVSSKADDYAIPPWLSDDKAMIVAKVSLGKISIHYKTTQHLTGPPLGYDSVLGDAGVDLNYDEQVLYKNEAVRPAYVVIYQRPLAIGAPTFTMPRSAAQTTLSNTAATLTAAATAAMATATMNSSASNDCTIM